jgi:uncharacterized coiled-coil protein SlyX
MTTFIRRLSEAVADHRQAVARRHEQLMLMREHDAIIQDRRVGEDHLQASWRARLAGEPGCPFCA